MKYLTAKIYRSDYDCSLNRFYGHKQVAYPCEGGIYTREEAERIAPAIVFVVRSTGILSHHNTMRRDGTLQQGYVHAEPADKQPGEWYSFGGSYIICSDSRFPYTYPVPLHDRRES